MAERILQDPKPHRTAKSAAAFRTISEVALELPKGTSLLRHERARQPLSSSYLLWGHHETGNWLGLPFCMVQKSYDDEGFHFPLPFFRNYQ